MKNNLQNIKCPELIEAKNNLQRYFKEHNLNPMKSYSKHPIHGKPIRDLVERLNLERAKVMDDYIEKDKKNRTKLFKLTFNKYQAMAKKDKKAKKSAKVEEPKVEAKVAKKAASEKPAKKEKAAPVSRATKYDYPLIDGREMTKEEKKKYRAEQRREAQGDKPKAEKKAKKEAKEAKAEAPAKEVKKDKKASKEEKSSKKLKKAKAKKVED